MTAAELVLTGTLTLTNLLLVLLVARRVRQLESRLTAATLGWRAGGSDRPWLDAGTQIPAFEAATISGQRISLQQLLDQQSMVGFFSPGCEPCRQQLPVFARLAADDGARAALAVVVGPASKADEFLSVLDGRVPVVREDQGGPVTTAFSARAFPGVFLLDPRGKVVASGPSVAAVISTKPDPVTARP